MDPLVSGLVGIVLGNLNSVALKEFGLAWGLETELDKLESVLNTIQLVLNDAETRQRKSESLRDWLQKLKNVVYDAENVLDEVATEAMLRKLDSETGQFHKLNAFISKRNPLLFKFKIAHKVKNIRERLDGIADERIQFHLGEGVIMDNRTSDTSKDRQRGSLVNESEICGRNEVRDLIIEKVVRGTCDGDDLSVYAICGMGGIGKTTLAQLVYKDESVKKHFELLIWVCVSDDFNVSRLIRAIIESIGGGCNVTELDSLQRLLQEKLRGKRFLMVLDDVWNENHNLWDDLKETINCGSKGSVVIVTSRSEKVATVMSKIDIFHVECLSEEDSWSVFSRRVFAVSGREETYMKEIGMEIVRKCKGVPLALKVLGSLMGYKSSKREWIQASETWQILNDENDILSVLRLSYDHLSLQLKQCFVYCCIYPKDYEMAEDQLIQLWMANGFISSGDEKDMYLTGRFIFKELTWRSFFQDVKEDSMGNIVCKMHDLMHVLAESVMKHETYIVEHGKMIKFSKTLRHLFIGNTPHREILENTKNFKLPIKNSLRSLIVDSGFSPFHPVCLSKQKYLRVLDFRVHLVEKLPSLIFELQHLRYLAIMCDTLERLPESLTRLQNLQTLKFTYTFFLVELPKGMKCMKNLHFLDFGSCESLVATPPELRELTCLQKLSTFIVGPDSAHHINQLKDLNLGGDLSIRGLDYVKDFEDAKSANLMEKTNLTSLSLSWMKDSKLESAEYFEEVLKGLQPNENIEMICINFYQGTCFPKWMSTEFLKHLKDINLGACWKCEHLPPLGTFPSLKCLNLYEMDSVKRLGAEWYGDGECTFPALTSLTIMNMDNLVEWTKPLSLKSFPCLTDVDIHGCPNLRGIPCLSTLILKLNLSIRKNMELLKSVMELISATFLKLNYIDDLDVLPRGLFRNHKALKSLEIYNSSIKTLGNELDNLSALQTLELSGCSNLEVLPEGLRHLKFLESLYIQDCDSFISIPAILFEGLSSFKDLSFEYCRKLKYPLSGPLSSTLTLQSLYISGLYELEALPESMQQLTALRDLKIYHCDNLLSLPNWIGGLQSLLRMKIYDCEELRSLPDSFQSLKSMRMFEIERCPHLAKRCSKPDGEDWPKVQHIPEILIH